MTEPLDTARRLAAAGFKVLPVSANKVPVLKEWSKRATDDPDWVEETFAGHRGGVGILTGRRGDLVVVDIDNKDGAALQRLQGLVEEGWPRTFVAQTRSGGFHLYYRPDGAKLKTCADWRDQIDIRAEGGQVVCYQIPDPHQIATLPGKFALKLSANDARRTTHDARDDLDLGGESFELPSAIAAGARNDTLYRYACSLLARGTRGGYVMRELKKANLERCTRPVPQSELDTIVESATAWWSTQETSQDEPEELEDDQQDASAAADLDEEGPLAQLLSRYVFVSKDNAVFDLARRSFLTLEGFKNTYIMPYEDRKKGKRKGPPPPLAIAWLRHPDRVTVFAPEFEPGEGQVFERDGDNHLNLWVPSGLVAQQGSIDWLVDHLMFIFGGDKRAVRHMLSWLAFLVQRPGERVEHALLVAGGQGIGKSILGTMATWLVGKDNTTVVNNTTLASNYNDWLEGTQLAVVQEFKASGKMNMMNELKDPIDGEWVRVEAKYRQGYMCRNHANFMLFSNFEDAAHLDPDDRRFWVYATRVTKRDDEYYGRLWRKVGKKSAGEGMPALLHFLQRLDLSEFDRVRRNPPATASKAAMIASSRPEPLAWLDERLEDRAHPFVADLVTQEQVRDALRSEFGPRDTFWAQRWLRDRRSQPLRTKDTSDGSVRRLWAVRDPERWGEAGGPERIAEWQRGFSL